MAPPPPPSGVLPGTENSGPGMMVMQQGHGIPPLMNQHIQPPHPLMGGPPQGHPHGHPHDIGPPGPPPIGKLNDGICV
jgi:hypothetical protein